MRKYVLLVVLVAFYYQKPSEIEQFVISLNGAQTRLERG